MFGDVNIVIIFELSNPFSLFYYIIGTLAKLKYFVFQNNTSIFVLAFRIEFLGGWHFKMLVACEMQH